MPYPRTDLLRFSNPRTQEEEEKTNNVWMKGHAGDDLPLLPVLSISHMMIVADHTSFTAIWSQPVTALQIKDWDGQWRYVRHVDNALVSHVAHSPRHPLKPLRFFRS